MKPYLQMIGVCLVTYLIPRSAIDLFGITDPSLCMLIGWISACVYIGTVFGTGIAERIKS